MSKQTMILTTISTLLLLTSACADNQERAETASFNEKATNSNALTGEAVAKVINANKAEIKNCYQKVVADDEKVSGKAILEWQVLQNGSVGQVDILSSTLQSNNLEDCIKSAIKGWQFPQHNGATSITVSNPIIFDTDGF